MEFKGLYTPKPRREEFFIRHIEKDGMTIAYAVDENGDTLDGGYLYQLTKDGIFRYTSVNPKFGFPLDSEGRILDDTF